MALSLRKYFVAGPFTEEELDQNWTDIEDFVNGLETDAAGLDSRVGTLESNFGIAAVPVFSNVRLVGLTAGHIIVANPSGGLAAIDMTAKGALLAGDGSGAPSALSVGTNGQLLSADSSEPTGLKWIPQPTGGSLILLATASASNNAAVDFTSFIDSNYDEYEVHLLNVVPATDSAVLWMRTSANAGSSFDAGASDYRYQGLQASASGTLSDWGYSSAGAAQIIIHKSGAGSDTNEVGVSAVVRLIRPSEATYTTVAFTGMFINDGGNAIGLFGGGQRSSAAAVDAVRFLFSTGNVESGLFKLYGVKKS